MSNIRDILAEATAPGHARTASARILLRQDLVARHRELEDRIRVELDLDNNLNRVPVAPTLAGELAELEAEIDAAKRTFTFRSIGKRAWADLIREHPPTKAQQKESQGRLDHNPETFIPAAMSACSVDPVMTVDDVAELEQALNQAQFDALWGAVYDANLGGLAAPKSMMAGIGRRMNERSATTAASEESPAASSSDE